MAAERRQGRVIERLVRGQPAPVMFVVPSIVSLVVQLYGFANLPYERLQPIFVCSALHAAALVAAWFDLWGDSQRHRLHVQWLHDFVVAAVPASYRWQLVNDAAWADGPASLFTRAVWAVNLLFLAVALIAQLGPHLMAFNLVLSSLIPLLAITSAKHSALALLVHTMLQTNNILGQLPQAGEFYMRAFFVSLVGSLFSVEALDVLLFRLFATSYVIHAQENALNPLHVRDVLPVMLNGTTLIFALTLLFISVLGVRGRLASMMHFKRLKSFLILVSLPSLFMLFAFSTNNETLVGSRLRSLGGLILVLSIALWVARRVGALSSDSFSAPQQWTPWTTSALWVVTACAAWANGSTAGSSALGLVAACVGLRLPRLSRAALMCTHIACLVATGSFDDASFVCALARHCYFFDASPWALTLVQELFMLGLSLVLVTPSARGPVAVMALLSSVFGSAIARTSRRSLERVVDIEAKSVNFVNHAIKQKLVGSGLAIEHALQIYRASAKNDDVVDELMHVLEVALAECRCGADRCHFGSVSRVIEKGQYERKVFSMDLASAVDMWRARLPTVEFALEARGEDEGIACDVAADWDLCFGLVCTSAVGSTQARCTARLDDHVLVITVSPPLQSSSRRRAENERFLRYVLAELGGSVQSDAHAVVWSVPVTLSARETTPATMRVFSVARDATIPPGLTMAVLDDNALSRRFMANFCTKELRAATCLVRGETPRDVDAFVDDVVAVQPAVCVLDQHLDWESGDTQVLGSEVATRLRKRGFRGAVVLHTASSVAKDVRGLEDVDRCAAPSPLSRLLSADAHGLPRTHRVLAKSLGSVTQKKMVFAEAWQCAQTRL